MLIKGMEGIDWLGVFIAAVLVMFYLGMYWIN